MTSPSGISFNTTQLYLSTQKSESECFKKTSLCHSFNKSSVLCFGATLPYESTSFDLVSDASNFNEAREKLLLWSG